MVKALSFSCNLCDGTRAKAMVSLPSGQIVACQQCGLRCYHPIPSEEKLSTIYDSSVYLDDDYFSSMQQQSTSVRYQYFQAAADWAQQELTDDEQILEIGPGSGDFLSLCQERGLSFQAIEISKPLAETIKARLGCTVYSDPLINLQLPSNSFSMVVAFDVLEHLRDPCLWLREVNRILKPGGMLVISTVSVTNLLDRIGLFCSRLGFVGPAIQLYPVYHLYYFTPTTLTRYIQSAGFDLIRLTQENYDPSLATNNLAVQSFLRVVYLWHDLTGNKTNLYVRAKKHA